MPRLSEAQWKDIHTRRLNAILHQFEEVRAHLRRAKHHAEQMDGTQVRDWCDQQLDALDAEITRVHQMFPAVP